MLLQLRLTMIAELQCLLEGCRDPTRSGSARPHAASFQWVCRRSPWLLVYPKTFETFSRERATCKLIAQQRVLPDDTTYEFWRSIRRTSSYWPSPACSKTIVPFLSMMYWAGKPSTSHSRCLAPPDT